MPDKRWLITGCGSGFGYALAEHLINGGHQVAVTTRDTSKAQSLAKTSNATIIELDVTNPTQARKALDTAWEAMGGIDVLLNCAGYGLHGAVEDCSDRQIRGMFDTNFFGLLDVTKASVEKLRNQGHGHIINISSIAGRVSGPLTGPYSASKFAVEGLSVALATELAPHGIKVSVVEPSVFNTTFEKTSMQHVAHSLPYLDNVAELDAPHQPGQTAPRKTRILT